MGVSLSAERNEANPGDDVRYWIKIKNLYDRQMPEWRIAFFFDRNQMQILETGGGRIEGDHITFAVPPMSSGEERTLSVRVHLYRNLRAGAVLRTYASMIWDGTIQPACAKHDLRIIERPPVTGAGDGVSPVENLQAFLRPINSASNGSPMPLLLWASVAVAGVTLGGRLGKKFIA